VLTAAARAADKANGGGGPFQRLGEGRGAALREASPAEALHTVPAARRAAAGDADKLFAHARPPTSKAKREAGERRAVQHQEWADAPKEKRQRAAEGRAAAQAALLAPLAATDTTASLGDVRMRPNPIPIHRGRKEISPKACFSFLARGDLTGRGHPTVQQCQRKDR